MELLEIKRYSRDYDSNKLSYITSICFCNGKRISLARFMALVFLKHKPCKTVNIVGTYFDVKNYYTI